MKKFLKGLLRWTVIIILIAVLVRVLSSFQFSGTNGVLLLISFLLAPICLLIGGIYLLRVILRRKGSPSKTAESEKNGGTEKSKAPKEENRKRNFLKTLIWLIVIITLFWLSGKGLKSLNLSKLGNIKQDYPICVGAKNYVLSLEKGKDRVEVPMCPTCWSGQIITPEKTRKWQARAVENKGVELWFEDGHRVWLSPDSKSWFPERSKVAFRAKGEGVLVVSVE